MVNKNRESQISTESHEPSDDLRLYMNQEMTADLQKINRKSQSSSRKFNKRSKTPQARKDSKSSSTYKTLKTIKQQTDLIRKGTPQKMRKSKKQVKYLKVDLQQDKKTFEKLITSQSRLEELFNPLGDATIHEEDVEESIAKCRESEIVEIKKKTHLIIPRNQIMLIQN